jgi:DNA-directed RNA polymerase subunit alpha
MPTPTIVLPEFAQFLVGAADPTLKQIRLLRYAAQQNVFARKDLLDAHQAGLGGDAVRTAILAYCLDFPADVETLVAEDPAPLGQTVLGLAYASVGDHAEALRLLKNASRKHGGAKAEYLGLLIDTDKGDQAEPLIAELQNEQDINYLSGRLAESRNRIEDAIDFYERVLETDQEHLEAAFKLGVLLDRIGDDDMAIEYYLVCADVPPHYVPGIVNLGILYDERGESNAAIACFRQALAYHPNNQRAQMLLRDARASRSMYYDEREERERERMEKILKTPVNDFELSVRSRNCLAKMNIFTLGDLISITEQEMLNYKNFGETSLKEVKQMLDDRNLRLGQLRENDERSYQRADQKTQAENVEKLELSSRTLQVLDRLGIKKIGELLRYDDLQLYRAPASGQSVVQEISTALGAYGLSLHQPDVKA